MNLYVPWTILTLLPLMSACERFAAVVPSAVVPSAVQVAGPAQSQLITTPIVQISGRRSAITKPEYHRITAESEWIDIQLRHLGEDYDWKPWYWNSTEIPKVDFERSVVIAAFTGNRGNSNGLWVVEILDEPDGLRVRMQQRSYQTAAIDPTDAEAMAKLERESRAQPFGFFVLPVTDKPILLEENTQNQVNRSPIWTERARL